MDEVLSRNGNGRPKSRSRPRAYYAKRLLERRESQVRRTALSDAQVGAHCHAARRGSHAFAARHRLRARDSEAPDPPTVEYHGIDIAIHEQDPNLREADIVTSPITFGDQKFDIVIAQGFFEYVGEHQSQKFDEIARLLAPGGTFIVSYVNFAHRKTDVYVRYSNVQPVEDFRRDLARNFTIRKFFPTSHNWSHTEPNRPLIRAGNMRLNANVPFLTPRLAVQYLFICTAREQVSPGL